MIHNLELAIAWAESVGLEYKTSGFENGDIVGWCLIANDVMVAQAGSEKGFIENTNRVYQWYESQKKPHPDTPEDVANFIGYFSDRFDSDIADLEDAREKIVGVLDTLSDAIGKAVGESK